jgi:hypothetical protein
MSRDPQRARVLGLWTAGWLAVFLIGGLLWLGEVSLQWPVLLVPVLWAVVALRPRRAGSRRAAQQHGWDDGWEESAHEDDDWPPEPPPVPGYRTDTVERPVVRPPRD